MDIKEYKTKTLFENRNFPVFNPAYRPIALDIGYSAVKGISPDIAFCFPRFAKKLVGSMMDSVSGEDSDILYKDENGIYTVGELAQRQMDSASYNDSSETMFSRNCYYSEIFKICARVGMAIGMLRSDGKAINAIQTGLPTRYIEEDAPVLRSVLAGRHTFHVKIGKRQWRTFDFTISPDNVFIMKQPMGTFSSILRMPDGSRSEEALSLLKGRTIILDGGFGTIDLNCIYDKSVDHGETFNNLGMRHVLESCISTINTKYGVNMEVVAIQKVLEKGYITKIDRRMMKTVNYPITEILQAESKETCMAVLYKMNEIYDYYRDVDNLIVTGGTGAAWYPFITDYLKEMENLHIYPGDLNSDLPMTLNNVRGYYYNLTQILKNRGKKAV